MSYNPGMRTVRCGLALGVALAVAALQSAAQDASPTLTTLYSFSGGADGGNPNSGVVIGPRGVLYGTTYGGGANGYGTVYALTPPASESGAWTETVIHNFASGNDGQHPNAGLVIGEGGVVYGTTTYGGDLSCTNGCGTVFSLNPPASPGGSWTETVIHPFTGTDGAYPYSTPVVGPAGVLYGTCYSGGTGLVGTAYSLTPPSSQGGLWTETMLHDFLGGSDGAFPFAGLTVGHGGVLYGATAGGGTSLNWGTIYSLTPPASSGGAWTKTTLYAFLGPTAGDGGAPEAPPVPGSNGVLYGDTSAGTFYGDSAPGGTAYSLTPSASGAAWTESVLYRFTRSAKGKSPYGRLIASPGGLLFGTAPYGADWGNGVAFVLRPPASSGSDWTEIILHSFTGGSDGANPVGGLAGGSGGVFFGTTMNGGTSGAGTVY